MSNQPNVIRIDGSTERRVFEGIGGITSNGMSKLLMDYPEAIKQEIMELLFKPNYGASLQHLKVEIGSDVNTSSGTEPSHMRSESDFDITRGYGLPLMKMAKAINPDLILDALRWGTPRWIKNHDDKFTYYHNFLKGARDVYGLEFDYLGPDINEGDFNRDWTVKTLRPGLDRTGFQHIKLVADDSDHGWDIADAIVEDPELNEAVFAMGVHYRQDSTNHAKQSGKPLWLSEDLAPFRHSFLKGALDIGERIIRMYADGQMVKYELHPLVEAEYNNTPFTYKGILVANWPWSGHYELDPGFWVIAHYTQFMQPGWIYVDSGYGISEHGGYVTLKHPESGDYSIVLVNKSSVEQTYEILAAKLSTASLQVWKTTETEHFVHMGELNIVNGKASIQIAPCSIVTLSTTTGQQKVLPASLENSDIQFPLPYMDDFSTYEAGKQPRYTSDQGGAFEIEVVDGMKCLVQQIDISTKPLDWTYRNTPEPYTLLGSLEWTNYRLSLDVRLDASSDEEYVMVGGRVNYTAKSNEPPEGYLFYMHASGDWTLQRGQIKLSKGKLNSFTSGKWYTISLVFNGSSIAVTVGGKLVVEHMDEAISSGHVTLGSGYHRAMYQNLRIEPVNEEIPVDCFRYDDRNSALLFGGRWENIDGDYNVWARTLKRSNWAGDRLTFRFHGTGVSIIGKRTLDGGLADVYVDGQFVTTVDCYAPGTLFRKALYMASNLELGHHTVALVIRGQSHQAAAGKYVYIDAVEVVGGEGLLAF